MVSKENLDTEKIRKKINLALIKNDLVKELVFKFELEKKNIARVKNLIDKYTFPVFIEFLIKKHDSNYIEKCRTKGFNQFPNMILKSLLAYVIENGHKCGNVDESSFYTETIKFENYYFCWMYGQGTTILIYDQNKKLLIEF